MAIRKQSTTAEVGDWGGIDLPDIWLDPLGVAPKGSGGDLQGVFGMKVQLHCSLTSKCSVSLSCL